jgi:hypothetical protein
MFEERILNSNALKSTVLAGVLLFFSGFARADAPAWLNDPCDGLDCRAAYAGVGQADFIPEMRLSSAVAYAQAARNLSAMISDKIQVDDKFYEEARGTVGNSALKAVSSSPLGNSMTKIYGDDHSDLITMAVELKRLEDPDLQVYAQEYVDVSSRTLYVRLSMSRSAKPLSPFADSVRWNGGRIRVSYQDIRAGRKTELTLFVEDQDADMTWEEYWPIGGAELFRGGKVASIYMFDPDRNDWRPARTLPPKND